MSLGGLSYNLFGNPLLDGIFTLIVKLFLAYLLIVFMYRIASLYQRGDVTALILNIFVGLAVLALIIGIDNVVWMGKTLMKLFPSGGGGGDGGGTKPAV